MISSSNGTRSPSISSSTSSTPLGRLKEPRTRLHSASDISLTHARRASSASREPKSTNERRSSCGSSTDSFLNERIF